MISEWYTAKIVAEITGVSEVWGLVAAVEALNGAFKALEMGIERADKIRDLSNSLETFTGSAAGAAKALQYLQDQAAKTRYDWTELATTFKQILPEALNRGFSQEAVARITIDLGKLATTYGSTLEQMERAFQKFLGGGRIGVGTNVLANALGLSADQIKEIKFDELAEKLHSVVDNFDKFGQSSESAFKKMKLAWEDAFGEGFNKQLGDAGKTWQGILDAFTKPEVLEAFKVMGEWAAKMVASLPKIADAFDDLKSRATDLKTAFDFVFRDNTLGALVWKIISGGASVSGKMLSYATTGALSPGVFEHLTDPFFGIAPGTSEYNAQTAEDVGLQLSRQATIGASRPMFAGGGMLADSLRFGFHSGTGFDSSGIPHIRASESGDAASARALLKEAINSVVESTRDIVRGLQETWKEADAFSKKMGWSTLSSGGVSDAAFSIAVNGMAAGPILKQIDPSVTSSTFGIANPILKQIDPSATLKFAKETAEKIPEQLEQAQVFDYLSHGFSNAFSVGLLDGWKGFVRSLADVSQGSAQMGMNSLFTKLFGEADPDTGKRSGGRFGDTQFFNEKLGPGVEGLATGFEAGMSGQSGSRTAGVAAGALSGFATGGLVGAAVGAIAAAIGGALGAQQRQSEYQFSKFGVDDSGLAYATGNKNIGKNQLAQMLAQVQETIDTFRNGYVDIASRLGVGVPGLGTPNLYIQDNPSSHFMEHFQQFLQMGLPQQISSPFMPEIQKGFEGLGLGADKFTEIMVRLSKYDPRTAMQGWSDLTDALIGFAKAGQILGGSGSAIFSGGPRVVNGSVEMSNVVQGPWAMKDQWAREMQQSFSNNLKVNDTDILRLSHELNNLVGPEQLSKAKQLADLVNQKASAEKAAVEQLIQLANSTRSAFGSAMDQAKVMGMGKMGVDKDGKPVWNPDNQGIAGFWRDKGQYELNNLRNLNNPEDIQAAQNRFFGDLNASAASMAAAGIDPKTISDWLLKSLQAGNDEFLKRIDEVGQNISSDADKFWDSIQPDLDKFKNATSDIGDSLGGVGNDLNDLRPPIQDVIGNLADFSQALREATQAASSSSVAGYRNAVA